MAKPISVEPSQGWDGNDGPWSTFVVRVGNPSQTLRVLASTTIPETWVVMVDGCTPQDGPKCANNRGNLFNKTISTTWEDHGIFELGDERNLNFTEFDNGDYGNDTLALGYTGSGGLSLNRQVVAGIATKRFYLGYLGLTPRPVNFSETESSSSYLSNLKAQSKIPSLSFGYSAGAYYRLKKVDATLTLGGYDASRFTPNNVSLGFATDVSRDLVVGLQSIRFSDSISTNKELMPDGGILAFVDSTDPHIWLPLTACRAIESAFNLVYDQKTDLYLVNDSLHAKLLAQNASLTFIIGNKIKDGETISITLPYLSFDLEASYEYLNQTTRYFPLRRAANDSQYTLGRTFLQESYLIVDYERQNFSLSQSAFIENTKQNLIPIPPLGNDTSVINRTPQQPPASSKLSGGVLTGIIVAILTLVILVSGSIIFLIRRRKANLAKFKQEETSFEKPELDAQTKPVISELYNPHGEADSREINKNVELDATMEIRTAAEVEGSRGGVEMEGSRGGVELESSVPAAAELDAGPVTRQELPSPEPTAQEMLSPNVRAERFLAPGIVPEQKSLSSSEMRLGQGCIPSPTSAETNALDYLPSASRAPPRSTRLAVPGEEKRHTFSLWSGRKKRGRD